MKGTSVGDSSLGPLEGAPHPSPPRFCGIWNEAPKVGPTAKGEMKICQKKESTSYTRLSARTVMSSGRTL